MKRDREPYRSKAISRTCTIILNGPLDEVFPLFGPIREKEWAEGWDPEILNPTDGPVEERMVFRTRSQESEEAAHHWTVSRYCPEERCIEYTVFSENRVWWIMIECRDGSVPGTAMATITYEYVGLNELGDALNQRAIGSIFRHGLRDWEEAINHFLRTGRRFGHH